MEDRRYTATIFKAMWYFEGINTDQLNKVSKLIFDKGTKAILWKKTDFSKHNAGTTIHSHVSQ